MKYQTIVDKEREEEVLIYVHQKNEASQKIEAFVSGLSTELYGYRDKISVRLSPSEIQCVTIQERGCFWVFVRGSPPFFSPRAGLLHIDRNRWRDEQRKERIFRFLPPPW